MALAIGDKTGNATITTSGTVTAVSSPVYYGNAAVEFNTISGGSIVDTDGQLTFDIPSGSIGSGDFTIESFISVSTLGGGYNHADFFLDLPALGYRIKTTTVSGKIGFSIRKPDLTWVSGGSSASVTDETYVHFMLTRESGTIKFYAFGSIQQNSLATSNTHDVGGDTVELGDLGGPQTALLRIDSFRISDTVRNSPSGSSYTIPGSDSSVDNVGSDTIVLITGEVTLQQEGTISTSANATVSADADIIRGVSANPLITSSLSSTANYIKGVQSSLSISLLIEDSYVESGYIDETYFIQLIANVFSPADASISAQSSLSVNASKIVQGSVSLQINGYVGSQQYVDSTYIEAGYFEATVDADLAPTIVTMSSSVTLTVTADEEGQANLSSSLLIGDYYVLPEYIERQYFVEGIDAIRFANSVVSESIFSSLSIDGDAIRFVDVSTSITTSLQVSMGITLDADISLASTSSLSVDAGEVTQGEIAVSIAATTSILAVADLAGEVSVSISATTSIQANAESSGDIQPGITVTLTCSAQVLRFNPRYTLIIPKETRVNTITQETRQVIIPKETRELEFFI